jgi:hypothetical protein
MVPNSGLRITQYNLMDENNTQDKIGGKLTIQIYRGWCLVVLESLEGRLSDTSVIKYTGISQSI